MSRDAGLGKFQQQIHFFYQNLFTQVEWGNAMPMTAGLCQACRNERRQFVQYGHLPSPSCAELWRLATDKHNDAWGCIIEIFKPWLVQLANTAVDKAPKICGLARRDVDDIVQDVWGNLLGYISRHTSEAQGLVDGDDLSRMIGLIKTTVKNRVLELCRKSRGYEEELPSDEPTDGENGQPDKSHQLKVELPKIEGMLDLLAFLQKHIQTEQEKIVAEIILLQGMKPQDVVDLYPSKFARVENVNNVRQSLIRRLRSDPARQKFGGSASLEFRLTENEVRMPERQNEAEPCPFDDGILLDYLHGHVSIEIKAAIERSPACTRAAAALQADLKVWQPQLRQMFCPDSSRLTAYQERRLIGTDYLVVHKHVQHCAFCQAEVAMLAAIDDVPIAPQPSILRRLYDLVFQPATMSPVPVLGEGSYRTIARTPQIELLVRTTRVQGRQRSWTLFGRLRYEDDQPFLQVEEIVMRDLEDAESPAQSTTVDEQGTFVVKGLNAGKYQLRIIAAEEEIVLNDFTVGE